MVQVAVAGIAPVDGLPPEIVTVGATGYPEPIPTGLGVIWKSVV